MLLTRRALFSTTAAAVAAAVVLSGCGDGSGHPVAATASPPRGSEPVVPRAFSARSARLTGPAGEAASLCVWLADTAERRSRGLMHVTELDGADGMVFTFPEPTTTRFVMWQTPLPLTVAFFDSDGGFVGAAEMDPCLEQPSASCPRYASPAPFVTALEVPAGAFAELLVPGASLTLGHEQLDLCPAGPVASDVA